MPKKPAYEELENRVRALENTESEYKKAIKELQLSEERFRNLFEQTPLGYQSLSTSDYHVLKNLCIFPIYMEQPRW